MREEFIRFSFEINLFFQRIMKEHLFFLETNLQPAASSYIKEAGTLKQDFEVLLAETVCYANGVVSEDSIKSNEFVTPYTLRAEEVSSKLTGAGIDTGITRAELELVSNPNNSYMNWFNAAYYLNNRSIELLVKTIAFQKKLLALTADCKLFITLYPEMLEHDTQEAEYYYEILKSLQKGAPLRKTLCDKANFWNYIMGEHSQFIDGMLDPTEKDLKKTAETLAKEFERLVKECAGAAEDQILRESIEATEKIKNYKTAATKGLLKCGIKSIIPPLLADHVLREANHYLRVLRMIKKD